jgi:uncharacterized membrane protein YeaQ/YmgE (transglycosylase-associated protein family)
MTVTLPTINLGSPDVLIFLLVGLVAGLLASASVGGHRHSILLYMVVGVIGAFVGRWLFGAFNVNLGTGVVPEIIVAFVGAFLLLLVVRAIGGGFGRRTT